MYDLLEHKYICKLINAIDGGAKGEQNEKVEHKDLGRLNFELLIAPLLHCERNANNKTNQVSYNEYNVCKRCALAHPYLLFELTPPHPKAHQDKVDSITCVTNLAKRFVGLFVLCFIITLLI